MIAASACGICACGSDERSNEPGTQPIEVQGGGVAGAALAGELTVIVVDAITGERLPGAAVEIGNESSRTNAEGVARLDVGAERPLAVNVDAAGYVHAAWKAPC